FLDSYNSALLRNQALANDGLAPDWTAQDIQLFKDGTDPYGHPNIDWWKTLIRPYSVQTTNTLNISGGTDKTKYFVSAGYLWQNGMVNNFSGKELNSNYYYKRYNFRSNLDIQATKTLSVNLDLSGNYSERNEPNIGGRNNRNKVLFEINDYVQLPPFAYQLYNPNGTYGANPSKFGTYSNNVIGRFALGGYNRSFDNDVTANLRGTQKLDFITKGLSVKAVLGYNAHFRFWRSMTRSNFPAWGYNATTKIYTPWDPNVYEVQQLALGYYADGPNSYKKLNYQGSINYDRTFDGHHVYALGLFNQTSNITGANSPIIFKGYVARVGYDFRQKYLLEVNAGYNGSSVFSTEKRYAWFPAVSAGWNLGKEEFFARTFKFFDLFKIRASLGLTGNDQLPNNPATNAPYLYVYQQVYQNSGSYSIGNVSRTIGGIVEGTLGTDVTWEKERQGDIGVDIKMFNNKLGITADYFDRERYDILITRKSVSTILGVGVPPVNLGRVQNRGFEVEASYNGAIRQLTYSFRGNISVAKNKILFQDEAQPAYPWLAGTGHAIGYLIGYTYQGFYNDTAEIAKSPKTPIAAKPGDPKYADLNGDGIIDPNDQRIMKYTNLPTTNLGFTTTVGYKGFALSFTLQSALNFVMRRNLTGNYTTERLDSWTPTNKNALLPRLTTIASVGDYDSDFWFRRMDYLRLKTINIGYQLPA
ncbi:MAG: SusC/RagA family TonB-linked outer membrane protein, partial [Bacteroidetes bacterium]|nr:SusC/RagA family TonB-linked outer membrane protein [Bacteroidota bacterium]